MHPTFDARDQALVDKFVAARDKDEGPRVGDFVHMLDGTLRRFTHHWGDALQTTCIGEYASASFSLGCGYMSFSGSLDPALPIDTLELTEEVRMGRCWIFHHDLWQAHNAVHTEVACRVYRQRKEG